VDYDVVSFLSSNKIKSDLPEKELLFLISHFIDFRILFFQHI
jgi:hypothetical protein